MRLFYSNQRLFGFGNGLIDRKPHRIVYIRNRFRNRHHFSNPFDSELVHVCVRMFECEWILDSIIIIQWKDALSVRSNMNHDILVMEAWSVISKFMLVITIHVHHIN